MTLTSYFSMARRMRGAPAAADVQQRHARLQAQLAQRQVDLGDLRLFQRHVVALEVRAAVGLGRVQEQPEEVVGQVVVGLHVLEVGCQLLCHDVISLPESCVIYPASRPNTPVQVSNQPVERWFARRIWQKISFCCLRALVPVTDATTVRIGIVFFGCGRRRVSTARE